VSGVGGRVFSAPTLSYKLKGGYDGEIQFLDDS